MTTATIALTPTTAALDEAACREILAPLRKGKHLVLKSSHTGPNSNPSLIWYTLWLVNRPGGRTEQVLGQGTTELLAYRQAAERVKAFGWQLVLERW